MRLSGLAAGIATFAVLGITNNILRYYEKIGPGLNTFSSVPETTDLLQATVGAVLVDRRRVRLPAQPPRAAAPRDARGSRRRARRRRLDLPPAARVVRALGLPRRVRRRPLHPLHPDQRRRGLPRPHVHHARDARHRRRRRASGARSSARSFVSALDSVLAEMEDGMTLLGRTIDLPVGVAHRRRERGDGARPHRAARAGSPAAASSRSRGCVRRWPK